MGDVFEKARQNGDIVCGEDGFFVFWPEAKRGFYTAQNLRDLADGLDEANNPIADQLEKDLSETLVDRLKRANQSLANGESLRVSQVVRINTMEELASYLAQGFECRAETNVMGSFRITHVNMQLQKIRFAFESCTVDIPFDSKSIKGIYARGYSGLANLKAESEPTK